MKKIFNLLLFTTLAVTFSSCNFLKQVQAVNVVQQAQAYLDKIHDRCPKTTVSDPLTGNIIIHYECDSLWNSGELKKHCKTVSFCIEAVTGKISGDIECDSLYKPIQIPNLK